MDKDQAELIKSVEDLKNVQADFQENLSNMDKRLTEVECKTVALEEITDEVQRLRQTINELHSENAQSCAKQGQLEDMQRRDKLLFYGLPDTQSESWAQAEEKVVSVLSTCLNMSPPEILVERAHSLGRSNPNKCRPIIAKFLSFKLKQQILLNSYGLKEKKTSPLVRIIHAQLA
ncbi:hypothetical protein HPB50_021358 [Hyalomma asiaticum]|uniref:Uncharacterized protein n=1 Tax=Hyalomma asiaticum TaxID=266040 RepID=A0ACB7SNJ0_HYAAI|nr:hypothetical protein HPB50_021358 [Hyalomma asiaticum]